MTRRPAHPAVVLMALEAVPPDVAASELPDLFRDLPLTARPNTGSAADAAVAPKPPMSVAAARLH